MEVNHALIDKLSLLARLDIKPAEKEKLRTDLEQMIGFIEKLQELDTTGIEPLMHLTEEINVLRADEVKGSVAIDAALQNARLKKDRFFMVPKVIKK
ncbi:aspartyl/glutamyl-tRNA(Asn/Gln) amidotransferase subunit C [Lacibacter cauensis]|uniref:Aspartyl/glutamyl-tRNA(Asn/Gln) amidotransferase subunit C n=1 Tax=Lacibacter cauensis TaxID=510947 RepID=A0A562SDZ0_9BACT|nr:Asp-tRNA(Asn)/Glu-tRNA(Gln) amidotransferase subunit GatC [Lacibacter cauensis]TWI79442.1 aspartyl/glutamyl-tRNA(Asn/Gln) amidotransferase subunit C [Lacibacter cauensis]